MAVETRRGCGYRKVGGLYLVGKGGGNPCDRLPFPLTICPCCSAGFKQARGWTWVDIALLVGGPHRPCEDEFLCPLCVATASLGKAGLLWIGERFYKTPADFTREAGAQGISRRIAAVPRGFQVGETWVLLAHPKTTCGRCGGGGLRDLEKCAACDGSGKVPGIFRVFRPERIEKIVTTTQFGDIKQMDELYARGITPVVVPDDDRDHQGTVYDDDDEVEPELFAAAPAGSGEAEYPPTMGPVTLP